MAFNDAIKKLNKRTGIIVGLSYYTKPSAKRNQRNQRTRSRLKQKLNKKGKPKKY